MFQRGTRNIPTIRYSNEESLSPVQEFRTGTQVLTEKDAKFFKYIDDNIIVEKLNFGNVAITIDGNGRPVKIRVAHKTQHSFRGATGRAGEKGMVVNNSKTQILVISDAMNYTPETYIDDRNNDRIFSGDSLKVLGFTFSRRPTVHAHIDVLGRAFRRKYWYLWHLKKIGLSNTELVTAYNSLILPTADYLDVVYHSMLTDQQDGLLEGLQVGALRVIFGYKISGRKLREMAGVKTLRERWVKHCDKFATKCANGRFADWFPLQAGTRNTRGAEREKYVEKFARCDRLYNSPLYYMRRRLNGKEG